MGLKIGKPQKSLPQGSDPKRAGTDLWIALALIVFIFIQYGRTLGYPFFFDDTHTIQNNPGIQSISNFFRIWTSPKYSSVAPDNWGYRPLVTSFNAIAWWLGKGATWPYHLAKKLLHAGVCFLLYLIWERLWRSPGFFPEPAPSIRFKLGGLVDRVWAVTPGSAAIALAFAFAVHPVNNQVVNYISASYTLFAGFLYLLAYYLYLRYREKPGALLLGASCLAYGLSVMAKEEGITLPAIVLLTEIFLPRAKAERKSYHPAGMMFCYAVAGVMAAGLLKLMFIETSNLARGSLPWWQYFITQWRAYLRYFALLVWPWDFNADNLEFGFSTSLGDVRVIAALCGNLLVLAGAWLQRKRYPVFLFSLLWFYIAVSPASSVVPLSEPVNDHRMYIAYLGLIGAILPWVLKAIESICRAQGERAPIQASGALVALAFVGLTAGTQVRNTVWSSQESLWGDTVEKNPSSGRAHNNLALVYMGRGDWAGARNLLDRCERIAPGYSVCKINQAIVLAATGHDLEAEKKFHEGIDLQPYLTQNKFYLGDFLLKRGRFREAIEVFKDIDQFASGGDLQAKLGWIRSEKALGHEGEVARLIEDVKRRFPGNPAIDTLAL